MTPNYDAAATLATETLIRYNVTSTPVDPIKILKTTPGVLVLSFAEAAGQLGEERESIIASFGDSMDAITSIKEIGGKERYIVAFNQRLPYFMVQRGLARELGHIMMHHDGTRPEDVRMAEAYCFAHHLICPRPLIHAIRQEIPLTVEVLGSITGCYERCLARMRKEPGAHVAKELNRELLVQFAGYIRNFLDFQKILSADDSSALADFGTYMDGYEE